ncbi:ArsR/SmtB family transcription factor [Dactylosporangium siamense]|uniref:Transcriptional regulator n=1 Tax=Dactylosporangium siamense TaxID=685454 RepID=A0A919PM38_9ACTN|nr:metalloregulator ArsR/SmtB family transcription factor [Dactylosporangium siamense]GIG44930.1 transcriptional regulator [Dactylosporangium siamense]
MSPNLEQTADQRIDGAAGTATPAQYDAASALFRALAAPLRLAIVELLTHHDHLHVHQIVDAVGATQTLVSQHLRVLRQAHVVQRIQVGRDTTYRLSHPAARPIIAAALAVRGN